MKTFTLLCLAFLGSQAIHASHLIGGYIRAKPVSNAELTYQITVSLYLNETAVTDQMASLTMCFGDGSPNAIATRISRQFLQSDKTVSLSVYQLTHTYAGPGTYAVTTSLSGRTQAHNIPAPNTFSTLLLETVILANGTVNRTPVLSIPETGFQIGVGQRVVFRLGATDEDKDSLVYGLAKPLTNSQEGDCLAKEISSYQFPNDLTRKGIFKLNNRTGDLTWDAPAEQGFYSVVVTVSEYRDGTPISQTTEEIGLTAVDQPGTPAIIPPYEPAFEGTVVTATENYRNEDVTLTVFPNPVDDRLQVVIQSANPATATIKLLDAAGKQLHELAFKRLSRQHEQVISMGSLAPGLYILRADVSGRSLERKVVKR